MPKKFFFGPLVFFFKTLPAAPTTFFSSRENIGSTPDIFNSSPLEIGVKFKIKK